jgi:putative ABC transport system permease protein
MALREPGFTALIVLVLALGIGANTAMFSVVDAVLLRPLPYKDSDRLVALWEKSNKMEEVSVAYPNFLDWQEQNRVIEQMAAFKRDNFNYTPGGDPERVPGSLVSADFFATLGVNPVFGRAFTRDDDRPGANPVVILSHGFWQRHFASNPSVVGQALKLNGKDYTVVGITPAGFEFNGENDVFVPLGLNADKMSDRGTHPGLYVVGRLKPGVTLEQAHSALDALAANLGQQYPETNGGTHIVLVSLYEDTVGDIRPAFLILLGAVALVLLIACANVANLLLARATSRHKEIAIRAALGASRFRVVRQLLTESVLLSVAGGLLGLLLAVWGVSVLMSLTPPNVPRMKEIGIDSWVLGFTFLVSIVTGVIFGLAPALQTTKIDLSESLKEGGRSATAGAGTRRMRNGLVVAEVAISLMLLIMAGLMIKSFMRLRSVSTGFDTKNVLTMRIALPAARYGEKPQQIQFAEQLLARVSALPGVQAASMSNGIPLGLGSETPYMAEGGAALSVMEQPVAVEFGVTSDYFRAMGIPLLKGRVFTERDNLNAPPVIIIDESLARKAFPGQDPIGKRLIPAGDKPHEIIGVVGDVKHYGPEKKTREQFYYSYLQEGSANLYLTVRTQSDPLTMIGPVRNQVSSLDKDQPVYDIKTMEARLSQTMAKSSFNTLLLGIFAAVALILSVVGIYGVISYSVTQRTHELGLRLALGAQQSDILKLVIGQGFTLAVIGVVIGIAATLVFSRVMASLLFGVVASDPSIFALASLLLILVALLASYLPAHRAMRIDPIVALRNK